MYEEVCELSVEVEAHVYSTNRKKSTSSSSGQAHFAELGLGFRNRPY